MEGTNTPTSFLAEKDGITLKLTLQDAENHPSRLKIPCASHLLYEFYGFIFRNSIDPMWPPPIPLPADTLEDEIQPWYSRFIRRVWDAQTFDVLIHMADKMTMPECTDLLCARMAIFLKYELHGSENTSVNRKRWLDRIQKEIGDAIYGRIIQYFGYTDMKLGIDPHGVPPVLPPHHPRIRSPTERYARMREAFFRWRLVCQLNPILMDPECVRDEPSIHIFIQDADRVITGGEEEPIHGMTPDAVAQQNAFLIRQFLDMYGPFANVSEYLDRTVPSIPLDGTIEADSKMPTSLAISEADGILGDTYKKHAGISKDLFESDLEIGKYGTKLGYSLTHRMNAIAHILFPKMKPLEERDIIKRVIRLTYLHGMIRFISRLKLGGQYRSVHFFRTRMHEIEDEYTSWLRTYLSKV